MQIFIINPNSDNNMTAEIHRIASEFLDGRMGIKCTSTPGAPKFIENYIDITSSGPGMIKIIKENRNNADAYIVACHYDPNLDAIKEIAEKPVVGIGEASLKLATLLGHKFSIITTEKHSIPIHEELARKYHVQNQLASIRAPAKDIQGKNDKEKLLSTSRLAVDKDNAEVIVLGCAGLSGLDKIIGRELGVPVLDGIKCALIVVEGLLRIGYTHWKIK